MTVGQRPALEVGRRGVTRAEFLRRLMLGSATGLAAASRVADPSERLEAAPPDTDPPIDDIDAFLDDFKVGGTD